MFVGLHLPGLYQGGAEAEPGGGGGHDRQQRRPLLTPLPALHQPEV